MFSTQPQPTYSYYNFAPAANHGQYSEGDEARWNLDDPRFTPGDHLWRTDEPVTYPNAHFDAKYRVQDYDSDPRSSFPQYTSHASQPRDGFDQQLPPFDTSFDPSTAFSQFHGSIGQEFSPFEPQSFSEHPASSFEAIPQNAPSYPARPLPPSVDSLSIPNEPDSRLLYGGQHDPTLSARYQPSFENLPVAASQQACSSLARPSSLNSLRFESDRSQSSPPRGRQSPSPSSRLHATPRRLNSNLSISIERAESSSRLSCHSRNSSSPHSASPFRSLPSPLSPVRKRPHSSHYESAQYDAANSSLAAYSSGTDSSNPQYLGELDSGVRESAGAAGDPGRAVGFEYASTGSEFVESYGLEQGVGELQIISRPSSSANGYPTAYHTFNPPPSSFDPLPLPPPAIKSGLEDKRRVREGQIRDFLRATDKLQAGERTVLILNPRIAQRSYGTERRLLNPPPMAYLLGTAWHPSSTDSLPGHHLPSPPPSRRILATPDVHVSIFPPRSAEKEALSSKESNPTATWMAPDGKTLLEHDEHAPVPICGRFVSKSLAVSLEGDLNKDTVSDVRTVVTVVDRDSQQLVGTFLGKPITVISKPSKKKSIMAGGTAGLVHGGLVALFNRTKAGSGSTRYLCTSGPQANFPTTDWKSMTSNAPRPFAPNDTADVRFISKTHSWDAFVIYAVDLTIPTHGEGLIQLPAPHQGYPKPPLNVVPVDARKSQALYYNQPVVLQCLATGVVSPVLIVRRIDSKTTVIGGGSLEPPPPNLVEISHLSVAPGERIGEPVSQYKNVAFEVFQAAATSLPRENPFDRRLPPSSFLGCVGEEIGIHVAEEEKTILKREVPLGPPTPAKLPSPPSYARNPLYASTNCFTPGAGVTATTTTTGFDSISEASSDDSDSTRKRARTSTTMGFAPQVALPPSPVSVGRPAAASRHKRRGQSLSSLAALQKSRSPSPPQTTGDLVWTVSCGESGVWSILAIDLARHSFFVPQSVDSMPTASMYSSSSLEKNPVPSTPVGPIIPIATRCEVSRRERIAEHEGTYAVLHGEHFDASYTIWVGDQPCAEQTVQSSRTVLFRPSMPAAMFNHPVPPPRRISIVRFDGVVFPTNVYYRD